MLSKDIGSPQSLEGDCTDLDYLKSEQFVHYGFVCLFVFHTYWVLNTALACFNVWIFWCLLNMHTRWLPHLTTVPGLLDSGVNSWLFPFHFSRHFLSLYNLRLPCDMALAFCIWTWLPWKILHLLLISDMKQMSQKVGYPPFSCCCLPLNAAKNHPNVK